MREDGGDFSDIIGMIIALVAVVYTVVVNVREIFYPKKIPPKAPDALDEFLEEFKKQQHKDEEEPEEDEEEYDEEERELPVQVARKQPTLTPPPAPQPRIEPHWTRPEEKYSFHPSLEGFRQKSAVAELQLETHIQSGDHLVSSSLKELGPVATLAPKQKRDPLAFLQRLPPKQALVLASEVMQRRPR